MGDTLDTLLSCSGLVRFDDAGNLRAFERTDDRVFDQHAMTIGILAVDTYRVEVGGFLGGFQLGPEGKRSNNAYHRFVYSSGELQLPRPSGRLEFATYGLLAESALCFFAGAPRSTGSPPASGQTGYAGLADGLLVTGTNQKLRLFGSEARLLHRGAQQYDLALTLRGVSDPFGDPSAQTVISSRSVTATLTFQAGVFSRVETLQSDGSTFIVQGQVGGTGHLGAYFTWQLRGADGLLAFGVIAADGNQI